MAELCLDCFNKYNETNYKEQEIWLEEDFCEGCAEWKPCVVSLRPKPWLFRVVDKIRHLFVKQITNILDPLI